MSGAAAYVAMKAAKDRQKKIDENRNRKLSECGARSSGRSSVENYSVHYLTRRQLKLLAEEIKRLQEVLEAKIIEVDNAREKLEPFGKEIGSKLYRDWSMSCFYAGRGGIIFEKEIFRENKQNRIKSSNYFHSKLNEEEQKRLLCHICELIEKYNKPRKRAKKLRNEFKNCGITDIEMKTIDDFIAFFKSLEKHKQKFEELQATELKCYEEYKEIAQRKYDLSVRYKKAIIITEAEAKEMAAEREAANKSMPSSAKNKNAGKEL